MTQPTQADLPSVMRATQYITNTGGLPRNLHLTTTAPLPSSASRLPRGSTLVRVAYSSPNPVDYKLAEMPLLSRLLLSRPGIPGLDYSGTVVESSLPDEFPPGARVFGSLAPPAFGAMAEYLVAGEAGCVRVPEGVGLKEAATVGVAGMMAFQAIVPFLEKDGGSGEGKKVFINGGSGGTGSWGILIAKALGAHVVVSCSGKNADLCRSLGADDVIDYRAENGDVAGALRRKGWVFDLIFDAVSTGATPLYWQAHHYLKADSTYVFIAGSPKLGSLVGFAKVFLWPTWLGGGQRDVKFLMMAGNKKRYQRIAKWMQEGKIKPHIEGEFALEDADQVYERMKSGRTTGKLVVRVMGE